MKSYLTKILLLAISITFGIELGILMRTHGKTLRMILISVGTLCRK